MRVCAGAAGRCIARHGGVRTAGTGTACQSAWSAATEAHHSNICTSTPCAHQACTSPPPVLVVAQRLLLLLARPLRRLLLLLLLLLLPLLLALLLPGLLLALLLLAAGGVIQLRLVPNLHRPVVGALGLLRGGQVGSASRVMTRANGKRGGLASQAPQPGVGPLVLLPGGPRMGTHLAAPVLLPVLVIPQALVHVLALLPRLAHLLLQPLPLLLLALGLAACRGSQWACKQPR